MPPEPQDERYQPMALVGVVLIALLGFSVFFLSFLVAPMAILAIFYVGFAASDRSKKSGGGPAPAPAGELASADASQRPNGYRSGPSALLTRDARAREDEAEDAEPPPKPSV